MNVLKGVTAHSHARNNPAATLYSQPCRSIPYAMPCESNTNTVSTMKQKHNLSMANTSLVF